jgi:hypothetical protein
MKIIRATNNTPAAKIALYYYYYYSLPLLTAPSLADASVLLTAAT